MAVNRLRACSMSACLALCGCVQKTLEGDANVYVFESWAWISALSGGLCVLGAAAVLHQYSWWRRLLVGLVGVFVIVAFVPALRGDRLVVDNQHFALKTGLWFSPIECDIRFDDVSRIELKSSSTRSRRRRNRNDYDLFVHCKNGERVNVPLGTLIEEALPTIYEHARAHGATVIDARRR